MKKMQKMIAVLFSVAMCAAMAVPAFAAETDTARNEEQETVMPRAIVYEKINIPEDGKFYKITDDFEMPAKSRVSFHGMWSPGAASKISIFGKLCKKWHISCVYTAGAQNAA